jgi:phosphate transport system substrate-binding protein
MRKYLAVFCGMVLLCAALKTGLQAQTEKEQISIRIAGADSMHKRIQMLSKLFTNHHPGISVVVQKGGTVDSGMLALMNNEADVAMASRKISDKEEEEAAKKGLRLVERLVGYGGLVIIAHPRNRVNDLTVDQVRKIFTGEFTRWKEVGGADEPILVVLTGEKHPGTLAFLRREILRGSPVASAAEVVTTFPGVMAKVSKTRQAIGLVRIRDAFESSASFASKVKTLRIRKNEAMAPVMPTRDSVAGGSYPLRRPYYLYINDSTSNEVKDLVDFIASKGWGSEG